MVERSWIEIPKPLPNGVARGWMALEKGNAVAGIFQVIIGDVFMLTYHVLGELKPRTERHPSFTMAQERANKVLVDCKVVPRAVPRNLILSGHA